MTHAGTSFRKVQLFYGAFWYIAMSHQVIRPLHLIFYLCYPRTSAVGFHSSKSLIVQHPLGLKEPTVSYWKLHYFYYQDAQYDQGVFVSRGVS